MWKGDAAFSIHEYQLLANFYQESVNGMQITDFHSELYSATDKMLVWSCLILPYVNFFSNIALFTFSIHVIMYSIWVLKDLSLLSPKDMNSMEQCKNWKIECQTKDFIKLRTLITDVQ